MGRRGNRHSRRLRRQAGAAESGTYAFRNLKPLHKVVAEVRLRGLQAYRGAVDHGSSGFHGICINGTRRG